MSKNDGDSQLRSLDSQGSQRLLNAENGREARNDDPKQNLGVDITLHEANTKDAAVVESCIEAHEIFASYIKECKNVETVEFSSNIGATVEEAEHRVKLIGSQWRGVLRQLRKSSAHTPLGALAKARVVEGYFAEYPIHDEIMGVMRSILKDLEGFLQEGTD